MKVLINIAVAPDATEAAHITNGDQTAVLNPGQSDTYEHDTADVFEVNPGPVQPIEEE